MKLYYRNSSKEERIANWQFGREDYNIWRSSEAGKLFIINRRRRQHDLCFICLTKLGRLIHIDHIFPLFLGGTNDPANLCITHPDCNMVKGVKVTMSYKQACNRRKLFNKITRGQKARKILEKRPTQKLGKKQLSNIKLAERYSL